MLLAFASAATHLLNTLLHNPTQLPINDAPIHKLL
jgi:hypothetical protein